MNDVSTVVRAALEWDALLPLIILLLWGLSRLFIKDDSSDQPHSEGHEIPVEDPAEADRARQIQEEIRRRVRERQGGPSEERAAPQAASKAHGRPARAEPARGFYSQQPERQESGRQEQQRGPGYEEQLARQMERVRDSERKSKELLRRSGVERRQRAAEDAAVYRTRTRVTGRMRREILKSLESPYSARKAIVLAEILGPPVSRRRHHPALLEEEL